MPNPWASCTWLVATLVIRLDEVVRQVDDLPLVAVAKSLSPSAQPAARPAEFKIGVTTFLSGPASVFGVPGTSQARLTDPEIAALNPRVFEVQSHGVTHRPLDQLAADEIRRELIDSRAALATSILRSGRFFAAHKLSQCAMNSG